MKKIKLFLAAFAAMVGLSANAQVEPVNEGVYYLYNTQTGKFLTRGNSYGTQAVTNDFGHPWQVTISDGAYTLKMYDIYIAGDTGKGLGSNGFSDNGSPIAFTPSGDATNGYTLVNGSNYLCSPATYGNSIFTTETGNTTWQFLNATQYAAILASKTSTQETAVANSASVDISGTTLGAVVTNTDNWRSSTVATYTPNKTDWTVSSIGNRTGNVNAGTYGVEIYQGAGTLSRTLTGLAQGIYKVSVKAMYRSASNAACYTVGQAGYTNSSAYFSANGNMVQVKDWYSGCESNSSPNSTGAFVTRANAGYYLSEVYCYVGSDGNLELKAVSESYWGASWFLFGDVTVTYYTNQVSEEDVTALINSIPTDKMSDAAAANIETAKTALQSSQTIANYNALQAAIDAAGTSIAEYATIASGTVPTDDATGWAKSTTNGKLQCNTWSTEGASDGSNMTTPFIEDWVASGTALGAGSLYYTFTDLNPGETYIVTALCRVYNEAGTGVSGATFFAGGNSKSISDFGAACTGDYATKGMFATLSCAGTVDENGQLQFGVELTDASAVNWISIKSVTIAEGTGDVPTSLTMSQSSASLTKGSTLSLTATIAPTTADDKTITWVSSNTDVATVAGGTVIAVGAGEATITATAYAGDNVTATCAVTVADAAAPSFYSTELAAGDYYIMNAATGQFLGGGNSWGTQASLIKHGIPFGLTVGEGVYTLDSYTYNNKSDHFFNGTYVDGETTNLYITSLGDGKFSISTADGSAFATASAGSTVVANTAADASNSFAQWYFLSKSDRDKVLASADAENPVDATYYIKQANISRNLSAGGYNVNAWNQYSVGGTQDNANFAAQVYDEAVDVYQTIEGVPNGTYTLTMQGFTSGSDVKFYAESANDAELNHVEVAVNENTSGATSCSAAAALFAAGQYTNTLIVTVTDRTLKIGITGDCSSYKWLCYDDFQMYMTAYTANTGVTASDVEVEKGKMTSITAATNPEAASFNTLTFTSNDETIATVDDNGVVTGVAVGETTITVAAEEMESFSTTINVTVTEVLATAEDYAALNTAITAAEAKTLGFEDGEYAPYNNAAAIAALATAKAIDQEADNLQSDVQAATAALTGATWTANDGEVNAIYDGYFTIQTVPASNTKPTGWSRHSTVASASDGSDTGYETRLINLVDGVTDSDKGMMTKFNAFYGEQDGYELPLKAETNYVISFKYCGYNEKPTFHVNVYNESGKLAQSSSVTCKDNKGHQESSSWSEFTYVFKTSDAGNYVIALVKDGGATTQQQTGFTELSLIKADSATMVIGDAKYATFIAPFDVTIPDDVKAYTVSAVSGDELTMTEVETTIAANTPVVVYKDVTETYSETFYGQSTATATSYTFGLLTGVYTKTAAPNGSYVLQKHDNVVGFYLVDTEVDTPNVPANRAYLNKGEGGVKAFILSNTATAIKSVFDGVAAGEIYDIAGRKVSRMQKGGIYVINGKKVMVK